ncbi:MAG: nucleotidyltransferase domain-containing protein [Deltaproteobacteria bacterium]|nr:nucleotidyltransferase domain-containing protein [Deltaproteobacteria bacterium]
MDPIIQKCKEILEKHYGDRFAGLILYGSQARGQAEAGSDIDLLVLLQGPFDYFQEIWSLAELLYPLQLEADRLISVKPAAVQDFKSGILQFYRRARREGVQL